MCVLISDDLLQRSSATSDNMAAAAIDDDDVIVIVVVEMYSYMDQRYITSFRMYMRVRVLNKLAQCEV